MSLLLGTNRTNRADPTMSVDRVDQKQPAEGQSDSNDPEQKSIDPHPWGA
jgi:hypothetical protein